MYQTSLDYLDRLRAKNIFKDTYTTLLGVLGSLFLIAATLAFYVPTIASFTQGRMYFQSEFSLQQIPFGNITIPQDCRPALVLYNKTDNTVANHTLLRQYMTVVTYQMSSTGSTLKTDSIQPSCDPAYFQNTLNPPQNFTDCIIFGKNSKVDITYYPSRGYVLFGFYFFWNCLDPFFCIPNSAIRNASLSNFTSIFNNFGYTLYFTSRVLQPDATFKDQVFAISSSSFNTPFTISSDSYGEIQIRNTTFDDSLVPWFNYKQRTGPAWYGSMSSSPKNSSSFTNGVGIRAGFVASRFQNQVFRYYKKVDWLLGIIGGAMFLFFIILYLPLYYLNQWSKQRELVEQFLIRHTISGTEDNAFSDQRKLVFFNGTVQLHKVQQSRFYVLKKILPCYESREEREIKRAFDIAGLIKMIKVAERNISNLQIPLYNNHKKLKINVDNQVEIRNQPRALPDASQIGQQILGPAHHQQNVQQGLVGNEHLQRPQVQVQQHQEQPEAGLGGNEDLQRPQVQVQKQQEQAEAVLQRQSLQGRLQQTERRLTQLNQVDPQTIEKYSRISGMHPEVVNAVIQSNNVTELMPINPTLMALANKQENYQEAIQPYRYSRTPKKRQTGCARFRRYFFDFIRFFDVFGVQPQFGLHSSGSSIFGCLCSIFIAGCSILFFIFIIINSMNYQTFIQYDFLDADKINYNLVTGVGFRPFFCVNSNTPYSAINSTNPTIQLTFFSDNGSQRTTIPMVNLQANMHSYLGIAPDSSYTTINTNFCWVMQDGITIPMGGYNRSNQGYFGFRFDPYCSGTVAYCESINATLRSRITTFISSSLNTFTLYLPFNTFDPQTKTLSGGGIHPQTIRQGTSGISINGGTVQSFYVNSIQLLDDYTMRFMDQEKPPVIQHSITTDRYQLGSNIHGVASSMPFYEVRVRPSAQMTKVVLTGIPTDVVLGVIGGICVLFYAVFHIFGKVFDHYNARCFLAQRLYGQQVIESSFFHKMLVLLLPECLCKFLSAQARQSVLKDKQIDKIIKYQLNQAELIKQCYTVYQLSTAGYPQLGQKFLALLYFKQSVSEDYFKQQQQEQVQPVANDPQQFVGLEQEEHESANSQSQNQMNRHENGVANLQQPVLGSQQNRDDQQSLDSQARRLRQMIQEVQPYNPHRSPYGLQQSNKLMQFMDWFSTKPSFTLNGQTKIRSVFGSCIFFGMVAAIIILVLYQIQAYLNGTNSRISFQKYMISDISNQPGFVLNSDNFRLALGFHQNPNVSLVNVSSLLNTSSNLMITVSQMSLVRGSNNLLTQTESIYQLTPCTNTYFDNFKDKNTDYTFLNNLPFAWCLPLNLSLNLTPISSRNPMQYLTVRIINKTNDTTTATNLRTLTSTYAVALYMTIPQIDLASRSFKYMVKQIRGLPRPTSSSTEYNVTLTKQQIVYTTPNYTLNPPETTVSSYIYLNNRNSERTFQASNSSLARAHNITFSYMGQVEKYVYQQPNANQIVGVIGGLIALFYAVALCIAESFNMYKFKYLVGKQLYLIRPKGEVLDQRDMDFEVELNQFQLLCFWLLSFFCGCRCFNKLKLVSILQAKAEQALNLNEFLVKSAQLRDTLNKQYFLQADPAVKVSNLFCKLPIIEGQLDYQMPKDVNDDYLDKHGLSSFDRFVLLSANKNENSIDNVFKDSSILRKMYYKSESSQSNRNNEQELRREKQSQSIEAEDPELRLQTTTFDLRPNDSFNNLKDLEIETPVERQQKQQLVEQQKERAFEQQMVQLPKPNKQQLVEQQKERAFEQQMVQLAKPNAFQSFYINEENKVEVAKEVKGNNQLSGFQEISQQASNK